MKKKKEECICESTETKYNGIFGEYICPKCSKTIKLEKGLKNGRKVKR